MKSFGKELPLVVAAGEAVVVSAFFGAQPAYLGVVASFGMMRILIYGVD